jgi:hypothetical protein
VIVIVPTPVKERVEPETVALPVPFETEYVTAPVDPPVFVVSEMLLPYKPLLGEVIVGTVIVKFDGLTAVKLPTETRIVLVVAPDGTVVVMLVVEFVVIVESTSYPY